MKIYNHICNIGDYVLRKANILNWNHFLFLRYFLKRNKINF